MPFPLIPIIIAAGGALAAAGAAVTAHSLASSPDRSVRRAGRDASDRGDYAFAISCYTTLIERGYKLADMYNNRGWAYVKQGKYDLALADCAQSLRLAPNNANTLHTRGSAYMGKGQLDRAIADFEEAVRIDPWDAEIKADLEKARRRRGR